MFFFCLQLILNGDLSNLLELFSICGNDRIPLAKALLQIFRHEQQEKVILKTMNDLEIAREGKVLFFSECNREHFQ